MEHEWQPIETAPKDGTAILAANARHLSHEPVVVRWKEETADSELGPEPHWADAATRGGDALYYNGLYFTHWMHLPSMPTA